MTKWLLFLVVFLCASLSIAGEAKKTGINNKIVEVNFSEDDINNGIPASDEDDQDTMDARYRFMERMDTIASSDIPQ